MSHLEEFDNFLEFVSYIRRYREPGPRRYIRDSSDPFSKYTTRQFYSLYRFSPHHVKSCILPMLEELKKPTRRGLPFAPEIMLLITLRYFATGSVQKLDRDFMGICQQSVSRIIATTSVLLAKKMRNFVKFPSTQGINTVKEQFYEIAHFPEVIGCIDCTHIKIKSPGGIKSELYRNTKGWFSINVQAVTGPNLEFFDLVARWPGGIDDSFIYNNSSVKHRLTSGALNGVLLGDNGYALSNVLLTPFLAPNSLSQEQYNKSHIETRKTVERAFGIWKRRFPCLQVGMGIKKETVVIVISACAMLHNLAICLGDTYNNCDDDDDEEVDDNQNDDVPRDNPNDSGFIARQCLVDRFFTNVQ